MTANYAWVIDKDYQPDPGAPLGTNSNAAGITGPSDAPEELLARLQAGEGYRFRMCCDEEPPEDKAYDGRILFTEDPGPVGMRECEGLSVPALAWGPAEAFMPLQDFGTPNAGAVTIYYFDSKGRKGIL